MNLSIVQANFELSKDTLDFLRMLLVHNKDKVKPTWEDVCNHPYIKSQETPEKPLKVTTVFELSKPLVAEDNLSINFGAIEKIKKVFDEELLRVMLTKVKKQKEGVVTIDDTGSAKLDVTLNKFVNNSDSQFKTITMPS